MTQTGNILPSFILFTSTSEKSEYNPSIVETDNQKIRESYGGKHVYTLYRKDYPELEAAISNEEIIRFINKIGFENIELQKAEGWIGIETVY